MTIYTARLDLALALRSAASELGDAEPDRPPGGGNGLGGAPGAEGDAGGPAGPAAADDAS